MVVLQSHIFEDALGDHHHTQGKLRTQGERNVEKAAYYIGHNNILLVVKNGFVINKLDIATMKDIVPRCLSGSKIFSKYAC